MTLLSLEELEKLYSRGYYFYETGNFPKAIEIFQELVSVDSTYSSFLQSAKLLFSPPLNASDLAPQNQITLLENRWSS